MSKSPGHEKWPAHKIEEKRVAEAMDVELAGQVIARSKEVIAVSEDKHPQRYYFPRTAVAMDKLQRSQTTTECPFKGVAHYFDVSVDGKTLKDAAWSYEEPYDEHRDLEDRIAFYDDKFGEIHVRQRG
jgi:uncharacterized protein (DUF427 family)